MRTPKTSDDRVGKEVYQIGIDNCIGCRGENINQMK